MSTRELKELGGALELPAAERSGPAGERLRRRAERAGLVDVAYAVTDSPLGPLLVAVTEHGVVRIAYPNEGFDRALQEIARDVSPRVMESPPRTARARKELDEYFAGRRRGFDVAADLGSVHGFSLKVLEATARIPFGAVASYRDVAGRAGNIRAARAAGNALHANPVPIIVPCHRVLRSGGGLGGYAGRPERKVALLRLEGALPEDA
jgi:methylated-DNA-[protein]-cysteine S-methyltransferase